MLVTSERVLQVTLEGHRKRQLPFHWITCRWQRLPSQQTEHSDCTGCVEGGFLHTVAWISGQIPHIASHLFLRPCHWYSNPETHPMKPSQYCDLSPTSPVLLLSTRWRCHSRALRIPLAWTLDVLITRHNSSSFEPHSVSYPSETLRFIIYPSVLHKWSTLLFQSSY